MKRYEKITFFLVFNIVFHSLFAENETPGIITGSKISFSIPIKLINNFIKVPRPDSAIFILSRSIYKPGSPDTTSLKDMIGYKIDSLNSGSTAEDYKKIINFLVETNNYNCFRIFYRNMEGKVFKFFDYHPDGTLKREVILVDPVDGLLEITSFYKNDIVLSRSQQKSIPPVNMKNTDSLWYGLTPTLKKTGNQTVFYPDGTVKSIRYFEEGKMIRVVKDTILTKDLFGNNLNYGQRKALLIGIDTYASPTRIAGSGIREFQNQSGCVNDVDGLARVLTNPGYHFRKEDVIRIVNENATREGILKAFDKLSNTLKRGDFVFIHFSGYSVAD